MLEKKPKKILGDIICVASCSFSFIPLLLRVLLYSFPLTCSSESMTSNMLPSSLSSSYAPQLSYFSTISSAILLIPPSHPHSRLARMVPEQQMQIFLVRQIAQSIRSRYLSRKQMKSSRSCSNSRLLLRKPSRSTNDDTAGSHHRDSIIGTRPLPSPRRLSLTVLTH